MHAKLTGVNQKPYR